MGAQDDVPDPEKGFLPPEEDIPTSDEEEAPAEEQQAQPAQREPRSGGAKRGRSEGDRPRRSAGGVRGQQTQVLAPGVLRIEAGPPDFALLDSGMVGEGRGLRIGRADMADGSGVYAGLGLGVSLGIIENLEVGILQLPLILDNGAGVTDFGNIELHGRYGVVSGGPVELAVQLVMQLPTNRWLGWGLGLPLRIFATDEWILDTGLELEVVTVLPNEGDAATALNLDFPLAVNYFFMPEAFVGLRSGMFVWDFSDVYIPAGVQGGYAFADGMVRMMGWFQWSAIPLGQYRYDDEVFDAGSFEFGVGANIFLGYRKGGG